MTDPEFTPAAWAAATDAEAMLAHLFGHRSEGSGPDLPRPLRLYLAALGRKQWHRLPSVGRTLVAAAEELADLPAELAAHSAGPLYEVAEAFDADPASAAACEARLTALGRDLIPSAAPSGRADRTDLARLPLVALFPRLPVANWVPARFHDPDLLRDLFPDPTGRPQRPCPPRWKAADVVGIADGMYAGRDFTGMPALHDALHAAGCDSRSVLRHCLAAAPHARGCWVVELLRTRTPA